MEGVPWHCCWRRTLHHLVLCVESLESPVRTQKVCLKDCGPGGATMHAFARGAFSTGKFLVASGGQGLFEGATTGAARRNESIQEVLQGDFSGGQEGLSKKR